MSTLLVAAAGLLLGVVAMLGMRTGWYRLPAEQTPVPSFVTLPLVTAVAIALLTRHLGEVHALVALPAYGLAVCWGTALAYADADVHRLPEPLMYGGVAGSALLLALASARQGRFGAWLPAIAVALAVGVALMGCVLAAPESLGLGDVSLATGCSLLLAWWSPMIALGALLWAAVLGGMWALALLVTRRAGMHSRIAYGPMILAGALLSLLAASAW